MASVRRITQAAAHLAGYLQFHSQTNLERVQTPDWRRARQREMDRCLARFKDDA